MQTLREKKTGNPTHELDLLHGQYCFSLELGLAQTLLDEAHKLSRSLVKDKVSATC
jgi:hypothetical protein